MADFCSGAPRGHWVNLSIDGGGALSSGGCDDDRFDPGAGGSFAALRQLGIERGDQVDVRMWLSRRAGGPALSVPDAELALGAYAVPGPAARVAGVGRAPRVRARGPHLAVSSTRWSRSRLGAAYYERVD